jgi:hypothetical protein
VEKASLRWTGRFLAKFGENIDAAMPDFRDSFGIFRL